LFIQRVADERLLASLTWIALPDIKQLIANKRQSQLSWKSVLYLIIPLRAMMNHAVEDGIIEHNPASKLGRFTKTEKPKHQAEAMTRAEPRTSDSRSFSVGRRRLTRGGLRTHPLLASPAQPCLSLIALKRLVIILATEA
jgi:hypothetical protein